MLKVYDRNHTALGIIDNLKDYKIEHMLSGEDISEFSLPVSDEGINLLEEEGYIRNQTNEYVVKVIDPSQGYKRYTCNINLEALSGKIIKDYYIKAQTLDDALRLALTGTGWVLVDTGIILRRTMKLSNTTALGVFREARELYSIDYKFDAINKKVYAYSSMGQDKGVYFTDDLNLIELSRPSNSNSFVTRLYPYGKDGLDITTVNSGKNYVENFQYSNKVIELIWEDNRYTEAVSLKVNALKKLEELSKPRRTYQVQVIDLAKMENDKDFLSFSLGDTITLLSQEEKFRDKQRIVKYVEYPEEPYKNTCELGNTRLTWEEVKKMNDKVKDTLESITNNQEIVGSKIDSVSTDQVEGLADEIVQVTGITAVHADIARLKTDTLTVTGNLTAVTASVGTLEANVGNLEILTVNHTAAINNLVAYKADINEIDAINISVDNLQADVAEIDTLLAGNISAVNIKAGAIETQHIKAGAITAESSIIANGAITTAMIGTGVIGDVQIADGSITDAKIVGLTASKITAGKIDAIDIEVVNLNAANITVGTINGQQIAPGSIGSGHIGNGTIDTEHIGSGVVTGDNIANGSITQDKIPLGEIAADKLSLSTHMLF